ncbi:hypothetical protein AN641_00075 [Candidatus Epulonipiscioides gigas]|nr:hypothetical protein AN641_00075 [Epulopiscium sp. SCG-C07WGA-EpuloA2]
MKLLKNKKIKQTLGITLMVLSLSMTVEAKPFSETPTSHSVMTNLRTSVDAPVYTSSSLSTRGTENPYKEYSVAEIWPTDYFELLEINGDAIKVRYGTSSGDKIGWIRTDAVFLNSSSAKVDHDFTAQAKVTTYRRPGGSSYGHIATGDRVYYIATSGEYCQVLYNVGSASNPTGYKLAFVTVSDYNKIKGQPSSPEDTNSNVTNRLNEIINSQVGTTHRDNSYGLGKQCYEYAHKVFNDLFSRGVTVVGSYNSNSKYYFGRYTSSDVTRVGLLEPGYGYDALNNLFDQAQPGDYIQMQRSTGNLNPHSMIVVSVDKNNNTINVLDANSDGRNTIKTHNFTYQQFKDKNRGVSIYRYNK